MSFEVIRMEEKTILFAVLGVVALVAFLGIVSSFNTQNTGMGIYIEPGQFYRGLAMRQIGSGEQSAVINIGEGVYTTAGESESPSASSKHITPRIAGAYGECLPQDENGFIYDGKGNIMVGWEVPTYIADKSNIFRCSANYFKDVSYKYPDSTCCWNNYESMLPGSTGAAYRS